MTKGKMVLELLKYAKSAINFFDQSEASIVVMWLPKVASDWSKFFKYIYIHHSHKLSQNIYDYQGWIQMSWMREYTSGNKEISHSLHFPLQSPIMIILSWPQYQWLNCTCLINPRYIESSSIVNRFALTAMKMCGNI